MYGMSRLGDESPENDSLAACDAAACDSVFIFTVECRTRDAAQIIQKHRCRVPVPM